jgi:rod shape-determining protein MreC
MARSRPWFYGFIGILALGVFALAGFAAPVRETLRRIFLPIARVASGIGAAAGKTLRMDEETRVANERVSELEARLRAQTLDYVRLRALEEENRALLAQANFISETGYQTLGARVISRSVAHQTAIVTIDRGARDGAEVGHAVVTEEGLFVGKIVSLGERTSVVMFFTDVRARAAAAVAGDDRLAGVVEGRGNGVAHVTLVPQAVALERDDVIVTAGTEEKIPGNLVMGIVNDVESKPTDPFKNAVIEPLAPLDRLSIVSVIVPGP